LNCFESVFDTCLVVRNQGIKMEEMLIYMYYQIYLRTLCVPILGEDLWLVVVDYLLQPAKGPHLGEVHIKLQNNDNDRIYYNQLKVLT
jgi:hypothetical protein